MDIVTDVLIRFRIIAQRSKGTHYFDRVVGLVVINIRQWTLSRRQRVPSPSSVVYVQRLYVCVFSMCWSRLSPSPPVKRLRVSTGSSRSLSLFVCVCVCVCVCHCVCQ